MKIHKNRFSFPFRLLLGIIYLVFLAAYGIALLSPVVSPHITQIPAFFNLAFGALLFALLFFLIYFLLHFRKSGFFLVFHLVLIALTANYISAFFPVNFGEGLKEKHDLRVMTYNVESFNHMLTKDSDPYAVGVIRKYAPDIVCLQESNIGSRESAKKWLRKYFAKQDYPYVEHCASKGLTLLSKYPIKESHLIEYKSFANGTVSYFLELNGKTLLLVNNHLESYGLTQEEKSKYKDYIKEPNADLFWTRIKEVKRRLSPNMNLRVNASKVTRKDIDRSIREKEPDMVLVLGDFNDTPMSYAYFKLRGRDMKDAYQQVGFGPGISYNERLLPFRIDHVLYGGELKAIGGQIPWHKEASDHNPVVIDFSLK